MARVLVLGGGIVGLSVARAVRARGHQVTLVEQGEVPNPQGASVDQHRMIRLHYGANEAYMRMTQEAFAAWERLWAELGVRHYVASGALAISTDGTDYAAQSAAAFRRASVAHEVLEGAALAERCPALAVPPGSRGILAEGGPLLAERIVADLHRLCLAQGVQVRAQSRVVALDPAAPAVTLDDGTRLQADRMVVAVGAWLPLLWPQRYGALPTYRQALVYVTPPAHYAAAWASGPALVVLGEQNAYSLPPVAGTSLKFGLGRYRRPARPSEGFAWDIAEGRAVIDGLSPWLRDAAAYRPLRMQVGYYVMDESRRFRLDAEGNCLTVTNCDGQMFKFGPLLGERIAAVLDGVGSVSALSAWAAGDDSA